MDSFFAFCEVTVFWMDSLLKHFVTMKKYQGIFYFLKIDSCFLFAQKERPETWLWLYTWLTFFIILYNGVFLTIFIYFVYIFFINMSQFSKLTLPLLMWRPGSTTALYHSLQPMTCLLYHTRKGQYSCNVSQPWYIFIYIYFQFLTLLCLTCFNTNSRVAFSLGHDVLIIEIQLLVLRSFV